MTHQTLVSTRRLANDPVAETQRHRMRRRLSSGQTDCEVISGSEVGFLARQEEKIHKELAEACK